MSNLEQIFINVKNGSNSFDVTSVGFDTEKQYTVSEFNQVLKKANEKWQENWDGLSYPSNIIIVTVENLHNEPCTYRVNLMDADYNSIQDIVELSPTPMHASISTEKAIEKLNKAESIPADLSAKGTERELDMITQDFKYFFNSENAAKKIAALAEESGIALEIHRYLEVYEERDPDRGHFYNISGTFADHHSFTLPSWKFRENSEGLKEFQPLPALIEALNKKMDEIASGNDNIVRYVNNDPQQVSAFLHQIKGFVTALENYQKVEHIPQQQDISHKTINAALSAAKTANGQKGSITMSNTKMECTSMFLSDGNTNSKTKAVASITVNDEFVIKGIKMYESSAGNLDIVMPSRKFGNDYQDVVFPITAEAREQMKQAVLDAYVKVVESGLDRLPLEAKDAPEKSASKVTVSIHLHQSNDETKNNVKAVGQIVIDDCIVVSGVTVKHGTNKDGAEKDFVSMPSFKKQDDFGEITYSEYAHAITKECYTKINNAVLGAYETLQRTEYKGVKLAELGEKTDVSTKYGMNSKFAEKLMSELEKNGIAYSAKVSGTTAISVRNADKAAVDKIEKDLSATLKKEAQKSEQQPDQKKTAPKKNKAH